MDFNKLQYIKETIEKMNETYQKQILQILHNEKNINISENNNGSFINLTNLDLSIINKIELFIEHYNIQQNSLLLIEKEKVNIKKEFFNSNKNIKNNELKETIETIETNI